MATKHECEVIARIDYTAAVAMPGNGAIFLRQGQQARIYWLRGALWLTHPHGPGDWCGPGGKGSVAGGGHPVPGANEGCLVIYFRSGDHVRPVAWFKNNDETVHVTWPGDGNMYFGPNDNNWQDNQGIMRVYVEVD